MLNQIERSFEKGDERPRGRRGESEASAVDRVEIPLWRWTITIAKRGPGTVRTKRVR
jgi:hypothetical protein